MEEKLEALLRELESGQTTAKEEFIFHQPDDMEDSESFKEEVLISFNDMLSISCDLLWSYYRSNGKRGDGYLTPDDPDSCTLDYLDVENFTFTDESEEEHSLDNLASNPELKRLFLLYVVGRLQGEGYINEYDNTVRKQLMKTDRPTQEPETRQMPTEDVITEGKVLRFGEFEKLK